MIGRPVKSLLLDTHVWIWISLDASEKLAPRARRVLQETRQKWISIISCWELAKLVERKRIEFSVPTVEWIHRSLNENAIRVADLNPEIAVESASLDGFHKDPADQIIVATSRLMKMPLLTSDRRILDFPNVETIWS
jgi:PIN domain nuclease of toxin-antitoxin system